MRIQIVLLAFCAVAHGAPNDLGGGFSAHGPFADYGAPAPPSPFPPAPPSHSSFPPGPPAPVKPPSPAPSSGDWAPAPAFAPAQPPAHQAPSGFYAPPAKPEAPAFKPPQFTPSQPFTPSQLAPAAPFQFYGGLAPAPAPHHPPAPAPAPAPVPVPAPAPSPVQQPAASYGGSSGGQESAESSEESTGLTNEVVNLSSAKTLKGKTLSDGRIQSLLSEQVHSHDSGGSAHAETSVSGGYSFNEPPKSCQAGETRNKNGACEKVQSSTNYYLFDVPEAPKQPLPPLQTPEKRVHYNVLLVRVPTESQQVQNINLSKDEQKTLVYVVRDPPKESPKLPAPVTEAYKPHAPAVFYVTPEKKHASAEKKEPIGYGIVAQEKPLPSPPSPSHGYNSGW